MNIGDRIDHEKYGEGIVSHVGVTSFKAIFIIGGEREFTQSNSDYEIIQSNEGEEAGGGVSLDVNELAGLVKDVLEKYNGLEEKVELGDKWIGGTMILKPEDEDLKGKEIPVETFFHKIVMVRDRLRVLEQNVNSNKTLNDEEKINLQQYITRIYGSLTTFNVLFKNKEDYFVGESSKNK
ncbi:MAG: hypothetical protein MRY83_00470 [Flavobacteriales bacterium]|nr:hypothetical protein [Flavobacteriales bacterium]